MMAFATIRRRMAGLGLVLGALTLLAAGPKPAAAHDWHHRHHSGGFFSFQFGGPGYYYYAPQGYYYVPPPPRYYYPPPAYYYYPPPAYVPGPSFSIVVPFGHHH
jgi:hypothetical protein